MRRLLVVSLLLLVASSAAAFTNDELLATIAMPLAVDAVANVNGVPQDRLADLVVQLNQANVQPVQFVQVVRYVPVALVPRPNQPADLVTFVRDQIAQGVTGNALVNAIVQQLSANYNVTPSLALSEPATVMVERTDYVPVEVVSRLNVASSNPLAIITLPLAVAAVSDIAGVPLDQLANLVATLNNANVPAPQMVQIVRYVPVALVDNGPQFVQFVQQQTSQGVTGPALVPVVTQQLRTYYPAQTRIEVEARPVAVTPEPPPIVVTRVAEVRQHPHGGPPGLIKKQLGLQTGAEVVHGEKPGRQFTPRPPAVVQVAPPVVHEQREHGRGHGEAHGKGHEKHGEEMRPMISATPPPPPVTVPRSVVVATPQAPVIVPPGKAKGRGPEGGGPPGQTKEHGNGKGKGKD